jgi:hypothetical protein
MLLALAVVLLRRMHRRSVGGKQQTCLTNINASLPFTLSGSFKMQSQNFLKRPQKTVHRLRSFPLVFSAIQRVK